MISSIPVSSQPRIPSILQTSGSDSLSDPILPLEKAPQLQTNSSTLKCCQAENKKATTLPVECQTGDTDSVVGWMLRERFKVPNDASTVESAPANTHPSTDTLNNEENVCVKFFQNFGKKIKLYRIHASPEWRKELLERAPGIRGNLSKHWVNIDKGTEISVTLCDKNSL